MIKDFIIDKLFRNNIFKIFSFRINTNCNNECIHCFLGNKHEKNLTFSEIKNIIDDKKEKIIIITGGEPTLHPQFIDILQYCKKRRKRVLLQSNGRLFSNENFTKEVSKYLDSVLVPIHSYDESIFDEITQRENSYKETIQGIHYLLNNKIYVMTQTVVNKLNFTHLPETFDFINSFKIKKMALTFPHTVGSASSKDVTPTYTEVAPYIYKVLEKYSKYIHTHYIPFCYLYPYDKNVISIDMREYLQNESYGIDYINDNWEEVNYYQQDSSKVKSKKCKECIFDKKCPGVWDDYYNLYKFLDINPIKKS